MSHRSLVTLVCLFAVPGGVPAEDADLILHGGTVVTVDPAFSIREAMALRDGKVLRTGTDADVMGTRGPRTAVIDLGGKTVLPGLIDSHVHASGAAMTEFDHPIPEMESIRDVLDHISARAKVVPEGSWIQLRQVFITRLREQRYPTRAELDRAAPKHPVLFSTGPDASLNTMALKMSAIDRDFRVTDGGAGYAEKDSTTGEPTGILRNCTRYLKVQTAEREPTEADYAERLVTLFKDYNSVGLTGIIDRNATPGMIDRFQRLHNGGALTLRIAASYAIGTNAPTDKVRSDIRQAAAHPLRKGGPGLRVIGIKIFLDGGMLTGSAYMREPWGVSRTYAITDPQYRGLLFIPKDRLVQFVWTAAEAGLQFTAHSVGDGAVHTLLEAYAEVSKSIPIQQTRPCLTHSNFMSKEAIATCARLRVVVDLQPAWLYLDARTLAEQFGYDRLRYFQPLHSLFAAGVVAGGGSDHMQKIGSFRSVNPYNPFLAMQTAITRRAKDYDRPLHPEEALTREEAIRFYTINNAKLMFLDDQVGSLEPGKLADFVVLDRDILTCPEDVIRDTKCLRTYLGGKLVYERPAAR